MNYTITLAVVAIVLCGCADDPQPVSAYSLPAQRCRTNWMRFRSRTGGSKTRSKTRRPHSTGWRKRRNRRSSIGQCSPLQLATRTLTNDGHSEHQTQPSVATRGPGEANSLRCPLVLELRAADPVGLRSSVRRHPERSRGCRLIGTGNYVTHIISIATVQRCKCSQSCY
jgi:hypothetical protein